MTRISVTKRLAMGVGVIALGVCCALPFRHAPPAEKVVAARMLDRQSTLGDGVSLQVPGQTAMATVPQSTWRPVPTEEESDGNATATASPAESIIAYAPQNVFEPPLLPDHYRPLFRPDAAGAERSTLVVQPAGDPVPTRTPPKVHTIHDGDTLEALASRYLGDPQRAAEILDANREVLSDPELLPIGVEILIPRRGSADLAVQSSTEDEPLTGRLVPLPAIGLRRGQ